MVEAITDGVFSEFRNEMILEEELETISVTLYFGRIGGEENIFPLERKIIKTEGIARAVMEELLKGPTVEEEGMGYFTSINPGVIVQKIEIIDGVAKIDLSKELEEGVGGSARVGVIRLQIEETLKQFETVNEVIISIDDRTEDILQP